MKKPLKCLWCKSTMTRLNESHVSCPNQACSMFSRPIAAKRTADEAPAGGAGFGFGDVFGQMFGGSR